jgi:phosphoglucosamine mutase
MGKYFGTDGVRGVANIELTPELAFKIGRCGGQVLTRAAGSGKPTVCIGMDTRISGPMLEAAMTAGLLSIGANVIRLGVVTTPAVAYLTRALGLQAGVMISASHNPVEDNGIKFFGGDGFKLTDETELEIERLIDEEEDRLPRPAGGGLGEVADRPDAASQYVEYLKSTVDVRLDGLRIVMDCANGAAHALAPRVFRELGAEVHLLGANPDGLNINDKCGSTHPENLQSEVVRLGADIGLSYDGDADRLIAVDERGEVTDGDYVLAILGDYLNRQGKLNHSTVVSTVMSNLGYHKALEALGIRSLQTAVGDRYVMEAMREGGYNLGGEQSGHVIFLDYSTTGDGILTSLQLVQVLRKTGKPLSELKKVMRKYPQVLLNVRVADKSKLAGNPAVGQAIRDAEERLAGNGRVLVRPSGTEALVRVMIEGPDEDLITQYAQTIAEVVKAELS